MTEHTEQRPMVWNQAELRRILECLLFVSAEPLSADKLAALTGASKKQVKEILTDFEKHYEQSGFILRQIGGGWQFATPPDLNSYIERLYRPKVAQLSRAALETLSVIAYKQPVTRQDIENIRQVNSDSVVLTLLNKNLICEVGRRETLGRPLLYGTTEQFLSFFGINSLADLPPLEQFAANENAQTEEKLILPI